MCREHNIAQPLLLRWKKEYQERRDAAFTTWEVAPTAALERRVAEIDTALPLAALDQALVERRPAAGLNHHSDRGVQYANGKPYDNAKAESFFKTLQREEGQRSSYQTFEEAEANIGRFIENVYKRKRLHSSLGYVPPAEFEAAHALEAGRRLPSLVRRKRFTLLHPQRHSRHVALRYGR